MKHIEEACKELMCESEQKVKGLRLNPINRGLKPTSDQMSHRFPITRKGLCTFLTRVGEHGQFGILRLLITLNNSHAFPSIDIFGFSWAEIWIKLLTPIDISMSLLYTRDSPYTWGSHPCMRDSPYTWGTHLDKERKNKGEILRPFQALVLEGMCIGIPVKGPQRATGEWK